MRAQRTSANKDVAPGRPREPRRPGVALPLAILIALIGGFPLLTAYVKQERIRDRSARRFEAWLALAANEIDADVARRSCGRVAWPAIYSEVPFPRESSDHVPFLPKLSLQIGPEVPLSARIADDEPARMLEWARTTGRFTRSFAGASAGRPTAASGWVNRERCHVRLESPTARVRWIYAAVIPCCSREQVLGEALVLGASGEPLTVYFDAISSYRDVGVSCE